MKKQKFNFEYLVDVVNGFSPCMNDYLYVYDLKNDTYFITESALERFRLPGNLFHNVVESHALFTYPDDVPMLQDDLGKLLRGEQKMHDLRYRWLSKEGEPIWINCKGRILADEEGEAAFLVGCINEIGRRQEADNVSGLLGENLLKEYWPNMISEYPVALLRIGIDGFKEINERLGNEYGDMVLKEVAKSIEQCLEEGQSVFRLFADEFLVVDVKHDSVEELADLYDQVRKSIDVLLTLHHYEVLYTISGGITQGDAVDADYMKTMKYSEFALQEAKRRGKNQVYLYEKQDYEDWRKKRNLMNMLRRCVTDGFKGFHLYFQPIISKDEDLLYSEALLRFQDEDGTWISPVEVIPLLEESGLIIPVGKWVMEQAFTCCREFQKYRKDYKVSINVSYIQILKSPICTNLLEAVHKAGITPDSVVIELTESGYLEKSKAVVSAWNKLKEYGFRIAVDDFGTGYSNLQNIGELGPNIVKIDRTFTMKALSNEYESELLKHIIYMVHSIQLVVVIEGIETSQELVRIREMDPDYIQGYYYSKPCSGAEFCDKFIVSKEGKV